MKIPFEGESRLVPTNLPEQFKQELLEAKSSRYIWIALPEPIRQVGHEFLFIVIPVKLTAELALEQCGRGVLCQTEAEAKESVELLTQQTKEPIVVVQSAGFGTVGKITRIRNFVTEISVRYRNGKDGKRQWGASEREIDKATGEVTVLRRQIATDETEAKRLAHQWQQEYEGKKNEFVNSVAKSGVPLPPPQRCNPLTQSDLKDDLPAAKWTALRRQWPHCFEIFEERKANPNAAISDQDCQDAYLLDLVEQGYDPKADTIRADLQLCSALTRAAKNMRSEGNEKTPIWRYIK